VLAVTGRPAGRSNLKIPLGIGRVAAAERRCSAQIAKATAICDAIDGPRGNVLLEGSCVVEHEFHNGCDLGSIKVGQRLVEGICVVEHPFHGGDSGSVKVGQRLVEGICVAEHVFHGSDLGSVLTLVNGWLKAAAL